MKRDEFIKTLGFGVAGFPLSRYSWDQKQKYQTDRPNILFITTDYQAAEDLPSIGSPFLQMPNVDRLCREGVVFENYYCTAPVCMPGRATLISSQYPHTHGLWDNTGRRWPDDDGPILMKELQNGGYQTTGIGKMHFNPMKRKAGFETFIIADNKGNGKYANKFDDDYARFLAEHDMTRWSYLQHHDHTNIFDVYDWPFEEKFHIDHYVGEQTVQFIENNNLEAPWFNWVSFNGPHNPWDPPAEYSAPYKRMDLPAARARPDELHDKPADHTRTRYNYTRKIVDQLDQAGPEKKKEMINRIRAGHYGGLSYIDHQVGRILESLEQTGQLDNTIIIYSSDHGCELGDHHNIHKGTFYERSATVPLVVWAPGRFEPKRVQSYGGHVDLMPTILSMADVSIPGEIEQKMEGQDISPVMRGDTEAGLSQTFLEIRGGTGIVNDQWKFSVYPRDGHGELYDRKEDPDELYNLFDDKGYRKIRQELQDRLVDFHPPLKKQIASMSPLAAGFTPKKTWNLKTGQNLLSLQAPYQQGKKIQVSVQLEPSGSQWGNGPVFIANVGGTHGYALYLNNNYLELALRRFSEDTVIVSPKALDTKRVEVGATITPDGSFALLIEGEKVSEGRVEGGLPEQAGRERILAPALHVGNSPNRPSPMGSYSRDTEFKDTIHDATLQVG